MAFKELKNEASVSLGYLQTDANERLGVHNLLHVQDEKSSGTNGGTFTAGAWRTRTFNKVKTNSISGASLASNQITLPAGTYFVMFTAPCYAVDHNATRLQAITPSAQTLLFGKSLFSWSAGSSSAHQSVIGVITLDAQTTMELQHISTATAVDTGFGKNDAALGTTAVLSEGLIWKVA